MTEFYEYLTHELGLDYFSQIELIHLAGYQIFLMDERARKSLFRKAEAARKVEFEKSKRAGKIDLSEEFSPRRNRVRGSLSSSSVNRHFSVIRDLFSWGRKWKWRPDNPTVDLDILVETPKKRMPWPDDESVQAAIDAAEDWAKRPFYFLAITGHRPVALKRMIESDVDMINQRYRTTSYKGRGGQLTETWHPMTEGLFWILRRSF